VFKDREFPHPLLKKKKKIHPRKNKQLKTQLPKPVTQISQVASLTSAKKHKPPCEIEIKC